MKEILKRNSVYLGLCLALLVALGIVLLIYPKPDIHLWLNQFHRPVLDVFFRHYTIVAEWIPYVIAVALLFYKAGWSAFFAACVALSGLVGQAVKHLVDAPRPLTYFARNFPDIHLQLVEGVRMNRVYSFPSGHTLTFFAMFFALSIILTDYLANKNAQTTNHKPQIVPVLWQILFFILAVAGAYSRIYLSQHFAFDIWGGIVVGMTVSMLLCLLLPLVKDQKWFNWHFFAKKTQKNLVD